VRSSSGKILVNIFEIRGLEYILEKAGLYRVIVSPQELSESEFYALIKSLPKFDKEGLLLACCPVSYNSREVVAIFSGEGIQKEYELSLERHGKQYKIVLKALEGRSFQKSDSILECLALQVLNNKYKLNRLLQRAFERALADDVKEGFYGCFEVSIRPKYTVEVLKDNDGNFRYYLLVDFSYEISSKTDMYSLLKEISREEHDPEDLIEELQKFVMKRGEIWVYSPRNKQTKFRFSFNEQGIIRPPASEYKSALEGILSYYRTQYPEITDENDIEFFKKLYKQFFGVEPSDELIENFSSVPILKCTRIGADKKPIVLDFHPMLSKLSLTVEMLDHGSRKLFTRICKPRPRERLRIIESAVEYVRRELLRRSLMLDLSPERLEKKVVDRGKIKFILRSPDGGIAEVSYANISPAKLISWTSGREKPRFRAFCKHPGGSESISKVFIKGIADKGIILKSNDENLEDLEKFYNELSGKLIRVLASEGIECHADPSIITLDMSSTDEIYRTVLDILKSLNLGEDTVLLIISFGPERLMMGKDIDYYVVLKGLGLEYGFVVQNIVWEKEAYRNSSARRYIINNIIIQVLAKIGIYYYGLSVDTLREYDWLLGFDVGRMFDRESKRYVYRSGAIVLMGNSGIPEKIEYVSTEQLGESINLEKLLWRFRDYITDKRILMFRDGNVTSDEISTLENFSSNHRTTFVVYEIIKSKHYRVFEEGYKGTIINPKAGTYVVLNKSPRDAVLIAADIRQGTAGTVRPLYIRKLVVENGKSFREDVTDEDVLNVYALTTLMYSMIYSNGNHSKMPAPLYLAQKFLEVISKVSIAFSVDIDRHLKDHGMLFFL